MSLPFADLPLYFENAAGQVREHPDEYAVIYYHAGQRHLTDFVALLTQAGQLLLRRGWDRLLSDQQAMTPYTPAEETWLATYWAGHRVARPTQLWHAVVQPPDPLPAPE